MSIQKNQSLPRRVMAFATIAGLATIVGACSLDVDNPTMIQDEDLTSPDAIEALVAGAAGDFGAAMIAPGGGGLINAGAMLTDDTGVPGDALTSDVTPELTFTFSEPVFGTAIVVESTPGARPYSGCPAVLEPSCLKFLMSSRVRS